MTSVEKEAGQLLAQLGLTIGTVESATGGLISHRFTNVPGSSAYFKGAVVSYRNEIKTSVIGVKVETLEQYGAVSSQVAEAMAAGGRKLLGVDICLADTGIAGPGGSTPGKPVGLFYLGMATAEGVSYRRYRFQGSREENKWNAAEAALEWLKEWLTGQV